MKVYFLGSHAVGKTTCARYVSEAYNLPMISETARMVLSEQELQIDTLRYNINLVDQYQADVFDRQLVEENKYSHFVSDRCIVDVLAYSAAHSRILPALLKRSETDPYIASLKASDSILFFVRPSKATLRADGVRESLTWDGVVAIDAMIKFMLCMWDLPYFQINMDNMQERIALINSVLSK